MFGSTAFLATPFRAIQCTE